MANQNQISINSRNKKIILYLFLLIGIIILILIVISSTSKEFHSLRNHQAYLEDDSQNQIEDWMTPQIIIEHSDIPQTSLFEELNITKSNLNLRTPLSDICRKKKIDCILLVKKLNEMVK